MSGSRLVRYDALILRRELRDAFAGWSDRVVLLLAVLMAAGFLHEVASGSRLRALLIAGGIGAALGGAVAGTVRRRLQGFATDSILAVDALNPAACRTYRAVSHSVAILLCFGISGIIGLHAMAIALAGYGMAVLAESLGGGVRRLAVPRRRQDRPAPRMGYGAPSYRMFWRAPAAAIAAAVCAWLATTMLTRVPSMPMVAAIALPWLLWASAVDTQAVRFMAQSGIATRQMVRPPLGGMALFTVPYGLFCLVFVGMPAVIVIFLTFLAMAVVLIARISVQQFCAPRMAQILLTGILIAGVLIAVSLPPALLLYIPVMLVLLWRRARAVRWMQG
ncbi:hypothetical protein GCM10023219_03290 [Stakelama sediminis]|uniref:Uncharacterized protein n=1 Tax=Stakelama sediminis TaxID=463200 RepID=A0A840YZV6_9SPHN|nr:hypothetical protein [Stakelama sediminis]MBB5719040.1 hypothetical protein [Stakelama sediminis]